MGRRTYNAMVHGFKITIQPKWDDEMLEDFLYKPKNTLHSAEGTLKYDVQVCTNYHISSLQQGDVLLKKKHKQDKVKQSLQRLNSKWNELLKASNDRGKGLGEAKDILEFNEQVDKVEMWIREKVNIDQ